MLLVNKITLSTFFIVLPFFPRFTLFSAFYPFFRVLPSFPRFTLFSASAIPLPFFRFRHSVSAFYPYPSSTVIYGDPKRLVIDTWTKSIMTAESFSIAKQSILNEAAVSWSITSICVVFWSPLLCFKLGG